MVRDEGKCGVSILSVVATDRVAGNERKGCYNTVQNAKAQATNPDEREVSSHLMLQKINIEDNLSESQKEKLSTLLLRYQAQFTIKPEVILSENGTQFHSPSWKRNLESLNVQVR